MKIHCQKSELVDGVQTVQSGLSARTTLPILLNFMMETEKSKLKVVSTDLEMGVKHYIPVEIESEGSITIPAKKFADILHSLPENQDIEIAADAAGKIQLKCGRTRFDILGAPKSEYPLLPEFSRDAAFTISAAAVGEMIGRTIFSAATDETRHALNGVCWTAKGGCLELAATDGRRLAVSSRNVLPKDKEFQIIVPTKILNELMRLLGSWDLPADSKESAWVAVSENQIAFQIRETTLLSRLVGGPYPRYDQLIPSKAKKEQSAVLKTADFLAVTRRAALCAAERGGSVKFVLKAGSLQVSASSPYIEFEDEIKALYQGEEMVVAFNPQFMIDALKRVDAPETSFTLTSSMNPALIEPAGGADYRFIIMPMRI